MSHSYGIRLSLYRKLVSTRLREEIATKIKVGITTTAAAKKVKDRYGSISLDRNYVRYSGRLSI